jgi:hypothetical protein
LAAAGFNLKVTGEVRIRSMTALQLAQGFRSRSRSAIAHPLPTEPLFHGRPETFEQIDQILRRSVAGPEPDNTGSE